MKLKSLLLVLLVYPAFSQDYKQKELPSEIKGVTVFLKGAQIIRTGEVTVDPGRSMLVVKGLSPFMDEKSIRVKAEGDFTIISVNHNFNYLSGLNKTREVELLRERLASLEVQISTNENLVQVLKEKISVLNANKKIGSYEEGISLVNLKEAIDFFGTEMTKIKEEELKTQLELKSLRTEKGRIEKEIADVIDREELPTGEVRIRVDSEREEKAEFEISYLVENAGWYPNYDIRVTSVEQPIELSYKADVYQNTGVDWDDVKLKFSNADPNQTGLAPDLKTWFLNYPRFTVYENRSDGIHTAGVRSVSGRIFDSEGQSLPGANIVIKGTSIGTVTDINGFYELTLPNGAQSIVVSYIGYNTQEIAVNSARQDVRLSEDMTQLSEVVVSGISKSLQGRVAGVKIRGNSSIYGYSAPPEAQIITTTAVENQTTFEFVVEDPYTIKSKGEKLSIDLQKHEIETIYEYYAVPKLDKDAFLIARIINWDQYRLLQGEANLYFEDAYVGRSILDAKSLEDTLSISLGRDKNLVIGRKLVDEYTKRRTVGVNKIEKRGYEIIVRNKKSQPVNITLYDQVPIPVHNEISVVNTEISEGILNEKTGKVEWKLTVEALKQKELFIGYEVKYPKREKLVLD